MDSVPFHFDTFGGFGEVQGLARLDEQGLELQFSTRDAMFGVLKTGMRSLRIPLDALMAVRYTAGWFWLLPAIELRVRDLSVLQGLPESEQGRVTLSLNFRDRHDGRAFAKDLDLMRAHRRIQQLDRTLDQMLPQPPAAELPPQPPTTAPSGAAKLMRVVGLGRQSE